MKNVIYENKTDPFCFAYAKMLDTQPHFHKEVELIYVKEGCAAAYSDRNCYEMNSGELFIAFPNQIHCYTNCRIGEYLIMVFSPDIFSGLKKTLFDCTPADNIIKGKNKRDILSLLLKASLIRGKFAYTMTVGLLNQAMALLLEELNLKKRTKSGNTTLNNVLNYCSENCREPLTLDNVATALHLNKYYISHLINKKTELSFNDILNISRINRACDLLEDTEKSVAEISEESGFGSIRTFNRVFFKVMNMTPKEYRKQFAEK